MNRLTDGAGAIAVVTGAGGFIGSAIVRVLVSEGYGVRAVVRPGGVRASLEGTGAQIVEADVRDRVAIAAAVAGAAVLVHAAADYRLWVPDPRAMEETNVEGTRIVMRQAMEAGLRRIVHTSSVATVGAREADVPADERLMLRPEQARGCYKRTKVAAERLVLDMIARDGLPAVIVNPATAVGPRDRRPTPTGRMILEAARGRMPAYVATGLNVVHVDDVAAGHLAALEFGRIGERYILGGANVPLSAVLADVAAICCRSAPRIRLPAAPLLPIALVAEARARITGREPLVTREGLRLAQRTMYFDDRKARSELGYRPRPYREGIADAVAWFGQNGYLA